MVVVKPDLVIDIEPPMNRSVLIIPAPGKQGDPGVPGSPGAGVIFVQEVAQSVIPLQHNLGRNGPVSVEAYSLDYAYQYDGYHIQWVNENLSLFVSDTPVSGRFLVL